MKVLDVENGIKQCVSQIFGIEVENLDPNASFIEDLGFDSLRALEILAALENMFSIRINPEKLQEMTTLNSVIRVTQSYVDEKK